MKPYNVEIFTPAFRMVGNTNIDSVTYKEDYLSGDENTITILPVKGVSKQDYIRISRGEEEYAGVITEITYGTDKSKNLMQISYKPLMELFDTDILFDVSEQGKGSLEDYICRTEHSGAVRGNGIFYHGLVFSYHASTGRRTFSYRKSDGFHYYSGSFQVQHCS